MAKASGTGVAVMFLAYRGREQRVQENPRSVGRPRAGPRPLGFRQNRREARQEIVSPAARSR